MHAQRFELTLRQRRQAGPPGEKKELHDVEVTIAPAAAAAATARTIHFTLRQLWPLPVVTTGPASVCPPPAPPPVLQTSTPKEREAAAYDEVVVVVDNVISHCGFRPDTSLTQELQVDAHG